MASSNLIRVQIGKETTWGTPVTATSFLRGATDDTKAKVYQSTKTIKEKGIAVPLIAVQGNRYAELTLGMTASYEDILYPLFALLGQITPTGTNPYVWTYTFPTDTAPTPKSLTVEYGYGSTVPYRFAGVVGKSIEISGSAGEEVKVTTEMLAKSWSEQTLTNSLAIRTVNPITMPQASFFMDAWGGTVGTTQIQASLIDFTFAADLGTHLKFFDGFEAQAYGLGEVSGKLEVTLEYNATSKQMIADMLTAPVQKQIEIRFTDSTRSMKLQFAGAMTSDPDMFDDRDGNVTVKMQFDALYHSTLATWAKIILTNAVQTLP